MTPGPEAQFHLNSESPFKHPFAIVLALESSCEAPPYCLGLGHPLSQPATEAASAPFLLPLRLHQLLQPTQAWLHLHSQCAHCLITWHPSTFRHLRSISRDPLGPGKACDQHKAPCRSSVGWLKRHLWWSEIVKPPSLESKGWVCPRIGRMIRGIFQRTKDGWAKQDWILVYRKLQIK